MLVVSADPARNADFAWFKKHEPCQWCSALIDMEKSIRGPGIIQTA